MAVAHDKPKYTVEDYMHLPEGAPVELIGGEFFVSPSPLYKHQRVGLEIFRQLANWVKETGRGKALAAPMDVELSRHDVVQPDVLYISKEREEIIENHIVGAPDLIAEVLSPGTGKRDLTAKKALYERHGVREYWIVDPAAETIAVFRLADGKLEPVATAAGSGSLSTPFAEGFVLDVKEVFAP